MKNNRREIKALADLDKARRDVEKAQFRVDDARANRTLECRHCLKRSTVTRWTMFQTMWFEGPHGCMGGSTWHKGEQVVLCPKCGVWNRLIHANGKRIASVYTKFMVKADPEKGKHIPGDWVNL